MGAVPHERSLVKRLEGKPFALLGINSDKDRQALKTVLEKERITWRSWWDGGSTHGPIAGRWNVQSWPTMYLLDSRGVVRFKGDYLNSTTNREDKAGVLRQVHLLDEAVDSLLKEMEDRKNR